MADVEVTVSRTSVQYIAWLKTSYIGLSMISEAGAPMIEQLELGPDQDNAFDEFIDQALVEISRLFMSRQGDAEGLPFESLGDSKVFRFKEAEPYLTQADSIKTILNSDVNDALYIWVSMLWFGLKNDDKMVSALIGKFQKLAIDIQGSIHRLHD